MYELPSVNENDFKGHMSEHDKALLVKFFIKPREDKEASRKEGRPIFKDVEYIDIKICGNKNSGACRPATTADKKRFPEHYRRFKDRQDQNIGVGTPLTEWPPCSRSRAEELAFDNVKTVEQLANMADSQVGKFMGLYKLKQQAIDYLEATKANKPLFELSEKNRKLEEQVAELQATMSKLLEAVETPERIEGNDNQKNRARQRAVKDAQDKVS